jgi:type I restriction enzyme S subunit
MQDKIATLLGTLDKRIDLAADANSSLEMIAGAIFKSWFVDFDPVRAKAQGHEPEGMDAATAALFPDELIESGKGELPRGWSIQQLSDFVAVNPLRSLSKAVPAPYLEMANAPTSGPRPAGWVNRVPISGCRFRNGDTLLAKITPCLENGKTAFVDFLDEGQTGWGSTEFVVLTPKPPIPPVFGYLLARDEAFRAHAIQSMSGPSGRQRIQVDQLAKFEFAVADADVYGAFGAIVQPMFESIKHNDEMAKTLADLRDTLLPRLISGKLRVPEAEKLVEAVL